jgi:hypothetical protein
MNQLPDHKWATWFQSVWMWLAVGLFMLAISSVTTNDAFMVAALLAIGSPLVLLIQFLLWKFIRPRTQSRFPFWCMLLVVPCTIALLILFHFSSFYGQPREVMQLALKEKPPLLFTVEEFTQDRWTDYVATLRIRTEPSYIKEALEKHFQKRAGTNSSGEATFDRSDLLGSESGFCRITVSPDYRRAFIEYAVD